MSLLEQLIHDEANHYDALRAVRDLLVYLGYDPDSPGLADTPQRVVRALDELTTGTHEDPADHLARTFPAEGTDHDELILVNGVAFTALCEHHLLPFTGTATVAYVPQPGAPVVGLSKLARLVDGYARRLTMQERITRQVTDALTQRLDTKGAACVLTSHHACMGVRGVRKPSAAMTTSSLTGAFREDQRLRDEFLSLARQEVPHG